jgi:eukaryotic translation initiation factor 2C
MDKDGRKEPIWVPAELCDIIPGCARTGKLTQDETTNMINIACNRPAINAKCLLEEGLPTLGFSLERKAPILASFGIEISNKFRHVFYRLPNSHTATNR